MSSDDFLTLEKLQCFSYYVNINLSDNLLNLILKRLLSFISHWSEITQIEVITTFINVFIPSDFDVPEETVRVTNHPRYYGYQATLKLPFCKTGDFKIFQQSKIDKFSGISKSSFLSLPEIR